MHVHRLRAEMETAGDFLRAPAFTKETHHFQFTVGQFGLRPAADFPSMSAKMLESMVGPSGKVSGGPEAKLTDRELEVLRLFGEGWSTEEVANRLHLSPKTVEVHRGHIKNKLGVKTTPEFLRFAIRWVASQGGPGA